MNIGQNCLKRNYTILMFRWFHASIRTDDANDGVNTRDKVWERDRNMALFMERIWGDTQWRYSDKRWS